MNIWIAEFDLEDGDTMPEHMDLEYKGAKLDLHCRPLWTPVSDPPKEAGEYFVTIGVSSFVDKLCYSHNLYSVDKFDFADKKRPGWYDYDSEWGYYEIDDVTAWMPLPEAYKPQEGEDKE